MWLFHPQGFCSVVIDQENPGNLLCRGRVAGDLEALFPGYLVTETPDRDYRFRTSVPLEQVLARTTDLICEIDYPNFKNATPKDRHGPYLRVWEVMYDLQHARIPKPRLRQSRKGKVHLVRPNQAVAVCGYEPQYREFIVNTIRELNVLPPEQCCLRCHDIVHGRGLVGIL